MKNELIVSVAGAVLLAVCCAGPFLLAGIGGAVALAIARAQPILFVAFAIVVAFFAASLVLQARRSRSRANGPGLKR